jgi:hypothetical protein
MQKTSFGVVSNMYEKFVGWRMNASANMGRSAAFGSGLRGCIGYVHLIVSLAQII